MSSSSQESPTNSPPPPLGSVNSTNNVNNNKDRYGLALDYREPPDAALPSQPLHLEALKGGVILHHFGPLESSSGQSYFVAGMNLSSIPMEIISCVFNNPMVSPPIGRLPTCDIGLEHPSISRLHALLQYRHSGTPSFCFWKYLPWRKKLMGGGKVTRRTCLIWVAPMGPFWTRYYFTRPFFFMRKWELDL